MAATLACAAAARSCRGPRCPSRRCRAAACRGGRSRSSGPGSCAASSGTSPRWRGKTHGSSRISRRSSSSARLSSTVVLEDPVRVGLVVDEVPEAAQLRPARELVEPLARPLGRAQVDPGDHAADPRVPRPRARTWSRCRSRSRRPGRAPFVATPARASSGSRSAGSNVRRMTRVVVRHPGHGPPARGSRSGGGRRRSSWSWLRF